MKKRLSLILSIIFMFSLSTVTPARAADKTTVRLQEGQLENTFTLEQLGYSDKLLVGPFDSTTVYFSLPANVKLAPNSNIFLQYALAWSGNGLSNAVDSENGTNVVAGTLLVYFNDVLVDTIILGADSQPERGIYITEDALNKVDEDGRHSLRFFLNAEVNCEFDEVRTTIVISKYSELNLEYETVTPPVDLTLFPQPVFQPDSILPNSALVVVPDDAEPYELQGALTTMAGLGAITEGNLNVKLVTNGSLTPELVATNHLIFVGLAKKFPNLQVANFPAPISENGIKLNGSAEDDGIIEAAVSPWSQSSIVLFVGGNSSDGVVKAAQAFSTGEIVAVERPALSLISTVNSIEDIGSPEVQTFSDLGYDDQTMGLYGENYFAYNFYASPEQAFSQGGQISLVLSHSDLLDYDQTGITILLNDEVVGGVQLSEESPTTASINLVPGTMRRGINRLEIVSDIVPHYTCYSSDILSSWVTISATSQIFLPVSQNQLDTGRNFNLNDFPYLFLDNKDLSDLAFVVTPGDSVSWSNAAQVAYYIGAKGGVSLVGLHVLYADDISDDELENYNFLIFGRATTLPIVSKINDFLPAPFDTGSDIAVQPSMLVNYSLLPDTSVGYVQLLPSPWNSDRAILAVLGNTQEGIPMAGGTLVQDDLVSRLTGNFAVLYGDQAVTTDTRLGVSKESIISQLPVAVTVTPQATESSQIVTPLNVNVQDRPQWILPIIGVVSVGLLILLVVMLRKESKNRKLNKDINTTDDTAPGA